MKAFIARSPLMLPVAAAVVALAATAAAASAGGLTAAQLQAQGWACRIPAGETLLNCRSPGSEPLPAGPTEVNFLVFDASGTTFLGTEHLIRSDLYAGQPCQGTPVGTYDFIRTRLLRLLPLQPPIASRAAAGRPRAPSTLADAPQSHDG
jgi:hypothetical protein